MKHIELETIPSIAHQYLRTVVARKSKTTLSVAGELASVSIPGVKIDLKVLKQYRKLCGFEPSEHMPITFPTVLTLPMQMELLLSDAFPYPLFGLVHIRNKITQYRQIEQTESFDIGCRLFGPNKTSKGQEFDVHVDCFVEQELVWSCVSTYLKREKSAQSRAKTKSKTPGENNEKQMVSWHVASDIGRRYGKLSGDVNPIHMYGVTAKLFGYKSAIAHGMWTKARCIAELEKQLPSGPICIDVSFKLPLYLPSEIGLFTNCDDRSIEFSARSAANNALHLVGHIYSA